MALGVSGHSHADPRHLGLAAQGAPMRFPAGWALLQHPVHGAVLFDCGYGAAARTAMQRGLRRVYRQVIGACCEVHEDPARLLAARGLRAEDIALIVISHFHPDHVGGLREFGNARLVVHGDGWRQVRRGGFLRLLHAQIWRELLPADIEQRLQLLEPSQARALPDGLEAFGAGWDLFGDGSVHVLDLPGHALGQVGVAVCVDRAGDSSAADPADRSGPGSAAVQYDGAGEAAGATESSRADARASTRVVLAADAFWRREQLGDARPLPWWTRLLAVHDSAAYEDTLSRLRAFRAACPDAWIIPAHCADTIAAWEHRHPASVLRGDDARGASPA
ncbi:MBL fold metallo-hydrolase [Lysobacter psychrotolerans]|uniref:MBL fold metallo-hydrolase n=1 Tax=Montanilutibacter psychrotolerans TaxID=1327343 RepID=A0A3M8SZK8_9GAMM|nr:MBL fold metallo-hydrolase [Lysobacter psychrotolerans]